MPTTLRPSRALFRFSGADAQKLLFDVVTGRLVAEAGPPVWWALLSPQGKIQAEGLSVYADGAFWLDADSGVADAFLKRMKMYRLRAAVVIDDLRDTHRVGHDPDAPDSHIIGTVEEAAGWAAPDDSYARSRIVRGVAELGPDFSADTTFPHDIGMDLLGGVDFKKGCYIGQEVVSRMQHRGTARRRPVNVSGIDAPAGSAVTVGSRDAGIIGTPVDGKAVAIVRLDRFDGGEVTVAGRPVTITLPSWATYRLGESAPAD
ncbi:MAG: folate-binding protein [Hyphomicrobiales bacterium]|nr:MAG: folate-binding protein [Hyphomicrobiales bacterium]